MSPSTLRFTSFPRTKPPPSFIAELIGVFRKHEADISTITLTKGLTSDQVLHEIAEDILALGFLVESGKISGHKIERPVFYGENGEPSLRYEIDAYQQKWRCGLEVEAGRGILGNAIFRDLFQAMVMVDVDYLCVAVPNSYKYKAKGRPRTSSYYDKAVSIADALYGHSRVAMPYGLTVIGY
jgi:hypothetical protein